MSQGRAEDKTSSKSELLRENERLRRRLEEFESADGGHVERRRALESRLYNQREALIRLGLSDQLARGEFLPFVRLATKVSAETLDVARVSVWLFNEDRTVLQCEQLYERESDLYSGGAELLAELHPRYFAALNRGRRVAAHDAHQDPDTAEFSQDYLTPQGITSMLDAPLRRSGELVGVICHEHIGPARVWAPEEQNFASSVADFLALVLESRERRRAERAFRSAQEELLRRQWQATKQVESELEKARGHQIRRARATVVAQVASAITREMSAPLDRIRAAAERLRETLGDPSADPREQLSTIAQEIRSADALLGNLTEVSRGGQPRREPVDLERLAREAFGNLPGTKKSGLDFDLQPSPFEFEADAAQLRLVLSNLIRNSLQAMEGEGRIGVHARRGIESAVIVLRDDGPGVPRDKRDRIFEPLYTSRDSGTGLGLQICRRILARHGGSIQLLDEPGPGAAFRLEIPLEAPEDR